MSQWYRKTVTKAVVSIVGILGGASFITSLGVATTLAGTINPAGIMELISEPYEESPDFNMMVENSLTEVFDQFRLKDLFEQDGAYAPGKVLDVMEYYKDGGVNSEGKSGISYTLEELIAWGEEFQRSDSDLYDDNNVIVCRESSGRYYYYYINDFEALADSGKLTVQSGDGSLNMPVFLALLKEGKFQSAANDGVQISDAQRDVLYVDCWCFGRSLAEKYTPQGAESILDLVNNSDVLNGKLSEVYDALGIVLGNIYDEYSAYKSGWAYLEEGNTNFTYIYADQTAKTVDTNKSEYANYAELESNLENMKSAENVKYMFVYPKLKDFETNMNISPPGEWDMVRTYDQDGKLENIIAVAVDTRYPVQDQFYEGKMVYNVNVPQLKGAFAFWIIGAVQFIIAIVWLALTAGKSSGDNEIRLTSFDRWKTEVAAAAVLGIWIGVTVFIVGGGYVPESLTQLNNAASYYMEQYGGNVVGFYSGLFTQALGLADVTAVFFYGLFTSVCFFGGYVSLVRRAKAKILWKESVLCAVLRFGKRVFCSGTLSFRVGLSLVMFLIVQWAAILFQTGTAVLFAFGADLIIIWIIFRGTIGKIRIKKGIEEIAGGNLEYKIELKGLSSADRDMAEKVNDIGSGMNRAIDEAMRNERLKTDLITNVSHDIKTPLTSIINYVDILKRSDIEDEKIRGYLDILEAKAQRLKTLTEDVVEASKVSSGNITLEYMDMDLKELIQQTQGEMTEKFDARKLSLVLTMPEEPAVIHVDGRRMWRVLENIFGNAAKYAMPGTRVYADLKVTEKKVEFSLKNVSEQQLNISADELTERFIRGDISRSTEGSGLGLSIAKSLTIMQGGEFELYLDGDLFKVDIRFERVK